MLDDAGKGTAVEERQEVGRRGYRAKTDNHKVQTGVRMEKRLVKVLKALAELRDLSLGDLLEYLVACGFAGRSAFSPEEVRQIGELSRIYDLDLEAVGRKEQPPEGELGVPGGGNPPALPAEVEPGEEVASAKGHVRT
jgi:hypothetical protein